MSIAEKKSYCRVLANHLRYISGLLRENGIIKDVSPIQSAAAMYQRSLNLETDCYEATIGQLLFNNVDPEQKFRKVRPRSISKDLGLELEFSIDLKANLPVLEMSDPFKQLCINFKLIAISKNDEYLINSWHIDRHISSGDEKSYFPHPIYHIQYGGRIMSENEGINFGNILLVDTPRIPCPPFDIVLSIDYIMANYYGDIWYLFKEDHRYNDAVRHSRKCFWYAYYKSIANSLEDGLPINENFSHSKINPQLQ